MPAPIEVTTPSPSSVQVVRSFKAPAQLVWDFHTRPQLIKQWLLGPDGWTMPVCEMDLRVGGRYRYGWHNTEGKQPDFAFTGELREIDPPTRIVHTESMEGSPGEAIVTTTFVERNGITTITVLMDYGTQELRDMVVATGMPDGMATSYDRLDRVMDDAKAA